MRLPYLGAAVVRDLLLLLLLLAVSPLAAAADDASSDPPSSGPLWIQPSGEWCVTASFVSLVSLPPSLSAQPRACADHPGRYGIDGTWSNFAFFIGAPAQVVYLSVATALSELWVVSSGGCVPGECFSLGGGWAAVLTGFKFNYVSMPAAASSTPQYPKHGVRWGAGSWA